MKIPVRITMWRASYFWIVIAITILLQTIPATAAENFQDIRVQDANATRPQLIFACDRQTKELGALFTAELISDLKELNAGIALSTEDFSAERAEVVRRLNVAGVPMTAGLPFQKIRDTTLTSARPRKPQLVLQSSTSGQPITT